jgi:hypothetical protein
MDTIDEYIKLFEPKIQKTLTEIRNFIRNEVPEATGKNIVWDAYILFEWEFNSFLRNRKKNKAKQTAHNRTVYASPPVGRLWGSVSLGRLRLPRSTPPTFCQPWKCYAFPYSGCQNVIYSRDVMRNTILNFR